DTDFAKLLGERQRLAKGDGVHILICREPPKIQGGVSDNLARGVFPAADVTKLGESLLGAFRAKDYDKGPAEAVQRIPSRYTRLIPDPVLNAVKDYAGFFSKDALERANEEIKELRQRFKRDIVIETFPNLPDDTDFPRLLKERGGKSGGDGIHILICK